MNKSFRKILIFSFMLPFLFSILMCCCFTNLAHAQEPVSCHETSRDSSQPQNTEDCNCDSSFTLVKKQALDYLQTALMFMDYSVKGSLNKSVFVAQAVAYQAPPGILSQITPLYIKNSVLRI